jgi:biotin carboxyl carrier protein
VLELIRDSDIRELELEENGVRIRLHRALPVEGDSAAAAAVEASPDVAIPPGPLAITAPLVGTFYRADRPGVPPLVSEGSPVDEDTVVGIIEALHELTDVEAGCRGTVSKVFATDGQPVEYGQPLFEVSQLGE